MVKVINLCRLLLLQMHINTSVYLKIEGQIKEREILTSQRKLGFTLRNKCILKTS